MHALLLTTYNKLLAKRQGPYKVICTLGKVIYEVDMPGSRHRRKVYYINLLKKWHRGESEETAYMVHVKDSESGEELEDDLPSWKEFGGLECNVGDQLCTEQMGQLEVLLQQKYQDLFKRIPGKTKAIKYFIHTADSRPVKQRPYRLPHAYWEEVKQELREMVAEGVIEPSVSNWTSTIVLV